jgi:hypothetical protein
LLYKQQITDFLALLLDVLVVEQARQRGRQRGCTDGG